MLYFTLITTVPDQVKGVTVTCKVNNLLNQCTMDWDVSIHTLHMYVCTYVCNVRMYICTYVYKYVCIYVCMYVRMY